MSEAVIHEALNRSGIGDPHGSTVKRVQDLIAERNLYRQALLTIARVDPYNMPADPTCSSREVQNWATLNGCVSWAHGALAATEAGDAR